MLDDHIVEAVGSEHNLVKYKDYYASLGVPRTATEKEIKTAYRKLARQHHPDANPGNKSSEEKFKELTEAYEVLKDTDKRRKYDMLGSNWKAGSDFQPPPDMSDYAFDFGGLGGMGGLGRGSAFSDFFEALFGAPLSGGPASRGGGAGAMRRGADQEAEVELSIEELAHGATRTVQITAPGTKPKTLEVKIPAGVRAGSKVRIPGEGGQSAAGQARGDLYLKVKVRSHEHYVIDGDNLICEVYVSPAAAVLGGETTVPTLDGPVKVVIPPGSQADRLLRLRKRGLPKIKQEVRGDQLVRIKVSIPVAISEDERELYEKLSRLEHERAKEQQKK